MRKSEEVKKKRKIKSSKQVKKSNENAQSSSSKISPLYVFDKAIKRYIEYYGDDIYLIRKKYKNALMALIPATILVALFGYMFFKPFLFAVPLFIFLTYFYPVLYTWSKASEMKKIVNNEAPFISLVAYVNSIVDKDLKITFQELSHIKELKVPRIEQTFIDKMTNYMNMSFRTAIEKRAIVHTGDLLGKLYSNYLAALNLGITIRDRLRDTMRDLLNELKDNYKAYVERASDLTELIFSVFLLVPIVLIGFNFAFKSSVPLIQLFAPLVTAPALYFVISSSQSVLGYNLKYDKYLPIFVLLPVIILLPHITLEIKTVLIALLFTLFSFLIYPQIVLANDLEKHLPTLLKELSQYLRIGYTVQNAIPMVKLTSERVNKAIEKYMKNPEEVNSPSQLFNITFKLLFLTSKSGTSSTAIDELGNAINEIVYAKNSTIRQLRLFDVLTVLTPVMLWMTFDMLGKMGSSSSVPVSLVIGSYSLASAFLFTKISRFTLFYFPVMLLLTIVIAIVTFIPINLLP